MYWYVHMFEYGSLLVSPMLVVAAITGIIFFKIINPRCWQHTIKGLLYRVGTTLAIVSMLLLFAMCVDYATNVGENTILIRIKDNELTGKVATGSENRGLQLFKTSAFMRLKDRIECNQDIKTADGKSIKLLITVVVALENPNKAFYIWRDSEKRPGSHEEANANLLDLISEQYIEVVSHATFEDLVKDRVSPKTFFGVNDSIKSVLKENGLELLDMKVLLRLPDKILGEIKSTIVIAETKPIN